jgi:16S rRNA (uracil1498-N3)-methyltransferase
MLTEMSERFYVSFPLARGDVELRGPEAHHLANVSRIRLGDKVVLFNGDGREYAATVQAVDKKRVALGIDGVSAPARERPFHLEIAAPLPKGDRGQFLIEKLTELGVTSYVPLQTHRSVLQPSDAKMEKMQRHVIEASKQCGRNTLMTVAPLARWPEYAAGQRSSAVRWMAHPGGVSMTAFQHNSKQQNAVVAVGPEGGWTDQEVAIASCEGWRVVDLGPRILRVETAAIVLAAQAGLD